MLMVADAKGEGVSGMLTSAPKSSLILKKIIIFFEKDICKGTSINYVSTFEGGRGSKFAEGC